MSKITNNHKFNPAKEPINPVYIEEVDVPGYSLFGIIGNETTYKIVLDSCDGFVDSNICVCGKEDTDEIHNYKISETEFEYYK